MSMFCKTGRNEFLLVYVGPCSKEKWKIELGQFSRIIVLVDLLAFFLECSNSRVRGAAFVSSDSVMCAQTAVLCYV